MQILGTDAYRNSLETALSSSKKEISLISAYITIEGIDWILSRIPSNIDCRVLTRWNCSDLVSGASDTAVFEKLNKFGYSLSIMPDLHAKVILIDNTHLFLGSANITNSGLKLIPGGNREIGTILVPTNEDIEFVNTLFAESILIDNELFQMIISELDKLPKENKRNRSQWSETLRQKFQKPPQKLWVSEMLWCSTPQELNFDSIDSNIKHDLNLLDINSPKLLSNHILKEKLALSRCWKWLENKIRNSPNKELYFGELSAELHNSFLDDPAPYRQTVKGLLSNLLSWSEILLPDLVEIDRPRHSQRVRLKINPLS